jgi:hypothetical protein
MLSTVGTTSVQVKVKAMIIPNKPSEIRRVDDWLEGHDRSVGHSKGVCKLDEKNSKHPTSTKLQ